MWFWFAFDREEVYFYLFALQGFEGLCLSWFFVLFNINKQSRYITWSLSSSCYCYLSLCFGFKPFISDFSVVSLYHRWSWISVFLIHRKICSTLNRLSNSVMFIQVRTCWLSFREQVLKWYIYFMYTIFTL